MNSSRGDEPSSREIFRSGAISLEREAAGRRKDDPRLAREAMHLAFLMLLPGAEIGLELPC
jgi:hypothetical protein